MNKLFYLTVLLFFLISCTSMKVNIGLKLLGVYEDRINLTKLVRDSKEVVFVPMFHIGTKLFYDDVKFKIDSLQKSGFIIYYEQVMADIKDTTTLRKMKKFQGFPIAKIGKGYISILESFYKIKYKKKLLDQPSYDSLGVIKSNSRNVDITVKQFIDEYEKRYGEIKLNDCDFKTTIYEKSVCKDKPVDKKIKDELMTDYRNDIVVKEVVNDKHKKIAIIYGKLHFAGIKTKMLQLGFKEINSVDLQTR